MAATSGLYQTVTIVAILVGSALLIMMVILYTQNQSKWAILDTNTKSLKGPISALALVTSNAADASNIFQVQDKLNKEQFSSSIQSVSGKPFNVISAPGGRFLVTMQSPPVQYPTQ